MATFTNTDILQLNRLYATLSRINHIIIRVKEKKLLFQEICEACIKYGEFRMAWIGLLDDEQSVKPVAMAGAGIDYLSNIEINVRDEKSGRGPVGRAVIEQGIVFCQDIATDPLMLPWRDQAIEKGFRALASVPIRQNSLIIGVFSVYAAEPMSFDNTQLDLIDEIGTDISFALDFLDREKERKNAVQELIKAKEKAEANETQFRLLLENAPQPIFIQMDEKFIYLNKAALALYGVNKEEVIVGTEVAERCHPEYKNLVKERIRLVNVGKQHVENMELKHLKLDNTVIDVEVSAVPIIFNNQNAALVFVKDITHRKQAEKLLQQKKKEIEIQNEDYRIVNEELAKAKEKAEESDRLKTAFLQNMSHEIRTPMNAIIGFSNLLMENLENKPRLEKFSGIIIQRCNDLLNIINDILDIAKIESGQMSINYEECNVIELFNELIPVVADYKKRIGKEHLKTGFICDLPGFTIRTDKGKLKQVFINLLTNAIKFTSEGYVEAGCKVLEDNMVWFYVSDTGIGIPEEKHHQIFERFVQLNASYSEGTGLGLSIVKGLIDRMGGRIIIRSEPQKGSTFLFQVKNNPPER